MAIIVIDCEKCITCVAVSEGVHLVVADYHIHRRLKLNFRESITERNIFCVCREFLSSLRHYRAFYGGLADQMCVRELASTDGPTCWNGNDVVKRCNTHSLPLLSQTEHNVEITVALELHLFTRHVSEQTYFKKTCRLQGNHHKVWVNCDITECDQMLSQPNLWTLLHACASVS